MPLWMPGLTPLGLLVLPERPLVSLHHHSAVLTVGCRDFLDPGRGFLAYQFPAIRIYVPALLIAGECRGSGDELSLQAAEEKGLPTKVLGVGGGGRHSLKRLVPRLIIPLFVPSSSL